MNSTLSTPVQAVFRNNRKKYRALAIATVTVLFGSLAARAEEPSILSLKTNRLLTWTPGGYSNGIATIQRSTSLQPGSWTPFYYDATLLSRTSIYPYPYYTDVTLPLVRSTLLPASSNTAAFFRIALQTNVPDPSLLLHLSFDDNFVENGTVQDVSGHRNNGMRYGRPGYPTNWPTSTAGPDGSQAAKFRRYFDGWGAYGSSGDYVGIPTISDFTNLPQTTITFWCHYYLFINGNCDCNATPLQAGMEAGAWTIGRLYDTQTTFEVDIGGGSTPILLVFPDNALNGDTGGWHYYTVTFDHGNVQGYFDGTNFGSGTVAMPALSVGGVYLTLAGWTFNESPWMDNTMPDKHPNNAWMNGAIDDVRIYNRVLSASEIGNLYGSFDKQPPTTPQNLWVKTDSSTQVELFWNASTDNFRVDGYHVRRNGVIVADVRGNTHFIDTGLTPLTSYTYTVQAFDPANNGSPQSTPATTNTPASGSGVDVIIDDADGAPFVTTQGTWVTVNAPFPPNFWNVGHTESSENKAGILTFRPVLPEAGNYQVYLWNPGAAGWPMYSYAANVPVSIVHNGATNSIVLNEQLNYAIWNYIGTYTFAAGTNGYVRIGTAGTAGDGVMADAVRFVK